MGRLDEIGTWLRKERERAGFGSAAALAKAAGLSYNYISIVERGELRPKSPTVDRIADALKLPDAKRRDFHWIVKTAGEPASVRQALTGSAIPGLAVWRYLPEFLYAVSHPEPEPWQVIPDEMYGDTVRAVASLLAWVHLSQSGPTRSQGQRLTRRALTAAKHSANLTRGFEEFAAPQHLPRIQQDIAAEAALDLSASWRAELFGDPRVAKRLVNLLSRWAYVHAGHPSAITVRFRKPSLQDNLGFEAIWPELVINVHSALVGSRLWRQLDLGERVGLGATWPEITVSLPPSYADDLRMVLEYERPPALRDAGKRWLLYNASRGVRFLLRLYDEPLLAKATLPVERTELSAKLAVIDKMLRDGAQRRERRRRSPTKRKRAGRSR